MAANTSLLPGDAADQLPPALKALLKAKLATLTVETGKEARVDVRLHYADAEQAAAAEKAAKLGITLARQYIALGRAQVELVLQSKKDKHIT